MKARAVLAVVTIALASLAHRRLESVDAAPTAWAVGINMPYYASNTSGTLSASPIHVP